MAQDQKIAVYSLADLKNTTDDALLPFMIGKRKFKPNHILTDVRLGLGYSAVIISAVTFYFDYTSTWEKTKGWTLWAVIAYFILNGALTLWIWGVEKGKVFNGYKENVLISFASRTNKYEPIYRLKVRYTDPSESAAFDWKVLDLEAPFTRWFTADGYFVTENFQEWLSSSIPVLKQK